MKTILNSEWSEGGGGLLPSCITISHSEGAAMPFSTHLACRQEDGSIGKMSGHYFDDSLDALANFAKRAKEHRERYLVVSVGWEAN